MSGGTLGPLLDRVPLALRGSVAYHVPQPPRVRAKLDANELPHSWPLALRSALGGVLAEIPLERYPDPRAQALRALVAGQHGVSGDQLVFGNGSDELIALLCAAFAGPILYPVPTFVYYRLAAVARGLPAIEVPLDASFELDEAAISRAIIEHRPSVVFLALPNNPTGTLWRIDFALELAARHRDTVIVSDEAYVAYSGKTALPELADHPNLVIMRTLSKVGMAGLRVGFTISAPQICDVLEKVRPPYNLSSLDQAAAVFALREAAAWSLARAAEVVAERPKLVAGLTSLPGTEVFASAANLVLVRFGAGRAAQIWQGLADRGIVVRNFDGPVGGAAGGPAGPLAGCLRITIGTAEENALLLAELADLTRRA